MGEQRIPVPAFEHVEDWTTLPLAVIDFETTGLDPKEHRIVEYGVALFREGKFELAIGELLDPEIELSEEVMKIHGITNTDVQGKPRFKDVLPNLISLLTARVPVAYNAAFDRRFLVQEIKRTCPDREGLPPAFHDNTEWIDPLIWVRRFHKYAKGKKLTDMCPRLGITLEDAHRATAVAKAAGGQQRSYAEWRARQDGAT
jgi:DNA polymerase-3 subunit epsilon